MKRFLFLGLVVLLAPALAGAATRARYRIDLKDGSQVFSRDLPVQRGSIVLFHPAAGGALTGLPAEEVVAIQAESAGDRAKSRRVGMVLRSRTTAIETLARPLQPGDIVVIGPTGDGSAQAQAGYGTEAETAPGAGLNTPPPNSAYGGGYPFVPTGTGPNGQPLFTPPLGNTLSAQSGAPPTVGPDGFPVTTGNPPTISPNGTPITAPPGTPGAAPPNIGPNGFPKTGTTAPPPGAAPNIGPNGTPILAPPGAPGSSPPAVAPNGTPASPPPGSRQ